MVNQGELVGRLERLEQLWRDLGSPLVELLRPGLSDEQIDELMAPTGLTLPTELRVWWHWHDGAVTDSPDPDQSRELGPGGWLCLPLREAVAAYDFHEGLRRNYVAINDMDLAEIAWRPGLFPFTRRVWRLSDVLAVDTLVPQGQPAPVLMTSVMGVEQNCGAGSVAEVVGGWVELLESGRYRVDENGAWEPRDRKYAEESRFLWLL